MREVFYVFGLRRLNAGPGPIQGTPYGYAPLFQDMPDQEVGQQRPELPPFDSEEDAMTYIENQRGVWGPLVIVKAYKSDR